jgi:hypothetical protein
VVCYGNFPLLFSFFLWSLPTVLTVFIASKFEQSACLEVLSKFVILLGTIIEGISESANYNYAMIALGLIVTMNLTTIFYIHRVRLNTFLNRQRLRQLASEEAKQLLELEIFF